MEQPTKDQAIAELKLSGEKMLETIKELRSENRKLREHFINQILEK